MKELAKGLVPVAILSILAFLFAQIEIIGDWMLSPIIGGLLIGAVYTQFKKGELNKEWQPGLNYCKSKLLNFAIILYGFQISISDLKNIGAYGFLFSVFLVFGTFFTTIVVGRLLFKLDKELCILIGAGASICGSAAVLSTGSILRSSSEKTGLAVGLAFLFGTLLMLLLPILYGVNAIPLDQQQFGMFIGSTLHSVGNVAGAAAAISVESEKYALITKMTRVLLLVPFLFMVSFQFPKILFNCGEDSTKDKSVGVKKIAVPWFALIFLLVILFNSFVTLPETLLKGINLVDKIAFTMAMVAVGLDISLKKIRHSGAQPLYLGVIASGFLIVVSFIGIRLL